MKFVDGDRIAKLQSTLLLDIHIIMKMTNLFIVLINHTHNHLPLTLVNNFYEQLRNYTITHSHVHS